MQKILGSSSVAAPMPAGLSVFEQRRWLKRNRAGRSNSELKRAEKELEKAEKNRENAIDAWGKVLVPKSSAMEDESDGDGSDGSDHDSMSASDSGSDGPARKKRKPNLEARAIALGTANSNSNGSSSAAAAAAASSGGSDALAVSIPEYAHLKFAEPRWVVVAQSTVVESLAESDNKLIADHNLFRMKTVSVSADLLERFMVVLRDLPPELLSIVSEYAVPHDVKWQQAMLECDMARLEVLATAAAPIKDLDLVLQLARNSNSFPTLKMESFQAAIPPPDESGEMVQPTTVSTELYRYVRCLRPNCEHY